MPIYRSYGTIPQKHYTLTKGPHGAWCHEELMTNEGFAGETSLLYHLRAPTSMLASVKCGNAASEGWGGSIAICVSGTITG